MEIDDVNPNEQGNNVPVIDTVEGEKDPVEIEKDQGSKVHLVNPIEEGGGKPKTLVKSKVLPF